MPCFPSLLGTSYLIAEDKPGSKTDAPAMEEMRQKMEAAGKPGGAHEALDVLVGDWTAEVKSWMAPDAPPMVNRGTAKVTWVMNGRFIQEEFTGEFSGRIFHGMSPFASA